MGRTHFLNISPGVSQHGVSIQIQPGSEEQRYREFWAGQSAQHTLPTFW